MNVVMAILLENFVVPEPEPSEPLVDMSELLSVDPDSGSAPAPASCSVASADSTLPEADKPRRSVEPDEPDLDGGTPPRDLFTEMHALVMRQQRQIEALHAKVDELNSHQSCNSSTFQLINSLAAGQATAEALLRRQAEQMEALQTSLLSRKSTTKEGADGVLYEV